MPELSSPIRVLIVDDHKLFNDGLKSMLIQEPAVEVIGQVYASKDTPHALTRLVPDILLMDFNMPGVNGLDMTRQLLLSFPNLNILIISMYNEQRYIDEFRQYGAKGYLLKTADVDELVVAIQTVVSGKTYFSSKINRPKESAHHADDIFLKNLRLTAREIEIINYIRQGMSSQQIADTMHVSFYTVETHRRNIHVKLGVKNAVELIRLIEQI
ncbi:response regulator transcription factor [Spirosoma flavus]